MIDLENKEALKKMPNADKKSRCRALYISTKISIAELSELLVIPKTTIYGWSKRGKWAMMKKKASETVMEEKTEAIIDVVYDSIDFWEEYQQDLRLRLQNDIKLDKKGNPEFTMTPAEVKHVGEAWVTAEERMLLLRGVYIDV